MPIDKLIPQYLNLDDDERILKSYEMTDALNVRVSHEEDGDAGVIKNVEGNKIIPPKNVAQDSLPSSGKNRCIGVCTSEAHKCVYFFIYNSEGNHGIYRYIAAPGSEDSNVYEKVYENEVLNFNETGYVNADLVVNQNAEHLLYFTDDRNEPRKINATRALAGGYNSYFDNGTIAQREDFLAVCKRPPMTPPRIEFLSNEERRVNRIKNSLFQFAYQYIYDDGEYSALSPASRLAVAPSHLSSQGESPFTYTKYNEIKVTLSNSRGPVKKIILYVRNGNTGYYSRVVELENSVVTTGQSYIFANDGIYVQAPDSDTQKTFDSVPQRAGAQTFSNNRLFYGNYVEGFDNLKPDVDLTAIMHPEGVNLTTVDVRLPSGGQLDNPRPLPSMLDKYRLAIGPDNPDWENVEWLGSASSTDFTLAQLGQLQDAGVWSVVAGSYSLAYLQYSIWQSGLDLIVPDTEKSLGGGHLKATSGVIYDAGGGAIIDTSQALYFNNEFLENVGDYPMRFEIDLQNLPEQGFSGETVASVRVDVSASSIGTANSNRGGSYDTAEIECLDGDGSVLSHTPSQIRYLMPKTTAFSYDGVDYAAYRQPQYCGNFSSLSAQSGMQFTSEVDLSGLSVLEAGNKIAESLKGQTGDMFVRSHKYSDYGPRERWRGSTALKGEGPDGNFLFAECPANAYTAYGSVPSDPQDRQQSAIYLSWSGFYQFRVQNASYDPVGKRVTGTLKPIALSLEADEGLVGKFNTGTNDRKKNFFLKDEDNCDDAKSHSDTYTDSEIRCRINVEEARLSTPGIVTAMNEFSADGVVEIVNESATDEMFSFKSGANHEFGIVYFDERGRHGGVQRIGSVEVPHLYDKSRTGDLGGERFGRTQVDFRIKHEPPKWATKYAPVYAGNNTYDFYLYTGVSEAFIPVKNLKRDIRSTSTDEEDSINNSAVVMQGLGGDVSSSIFLSMRPLEGKPNSAKELLGSMKTYQYQEGDRLRIVEYTTADGKIVRPDIEIPITGYQYLIDDENNPLKVISEGEDVDEGPKDDIYRTTGWFLSVKNPNLSGFRRRDVASGSDLWSQNCKVQIVRYKKTAENPVYSEIGKMLDVIVDGDVRKHQSERDVIGLTVKPRSIRAFDSPFRLYVGDRLIFAQDITNQGYVEVTRVIPKSGGGFVYEVSTKTLFNSNVVLGTSYAAGIMNSDACLTLSAGDTYLKLRRQITNVEEDFRPALSAGTIMTYNPTLPRKAQYRSFVVEDDSVSDFFESNSYSVGRAHVENLEQEQIRRVSSITYSDPFAFDSNRLNLSSFNPTLFPYKDMPSKYGEITSLVDGNESITCLQESKVSIVPVNRNVVEMGGDSSLVASTEVLGTPTFMAGEFGPGVTKDGVVNRFGQLYFSDVRAGRVCRIDGSGITPISEVKMESYFEGLFGGVNNCVAKPKIPSGFDPENGEYIVTTEPIDFAKFIIDDSTIGFCPQPEPNMVFSDIKATPTFSKDMLLSWGTEKMEWDEVDDLDPNDAPAFEPYLPNWDEMHQGTIYIDRITERSGVYIDPEFENPIQDDGIVDVIKIDVVDQLKTVRGFFRISLRDFTIDAKTVVDPEEEDNKNVTMLRMTSGPDLTILTIAPVVDPDRATVAWSPSAEKWLTFYSFIPEMYANIQNRFFSFKDGKMWQHNQLSVRNSFYEEDEDLTKRYPSRLRLISRGNPSSIKAYKAMSTEGNRAWSVKLSNDTQRVAEIEAAHFHLKEGMRYANIPRVFDNDLTNAESPSDGNNNDIPSTAYRTIGQVASVDGQTITFNSNINQTPVITGPSAKVVRFRPADEFGEGGDNGWTDVGSWKISGVNDYTTVSCDDTVSNIQAGDFIANVYTTGVDGDMFRGYYAQISLENSESKDGGYAGPIEFYAANMVYDVSSLHNDGGQPNNQ